MTRRAKGEPVPAGAFLNAKQTTTVAIGFLDWLAGRGRRLETATQADLDAWYASGPSTREHVTRFLGWARDHKIITLDQPTIRHRAGPVMSETERLDHLNRLLDDPTLPVTPRLIGLLVLLFGQPLSRIIRIPRDAVTVDDELVTIRLGQHPLTLPPDIAMIIREHLGKLGQRRNQAGHPDQRWLFPGLQPGEPLHQSSPSIMLKQIGLPARAARNTAWQQMVYQASAAVLADELGTQRGTVTRHARLAGAEYASYPGADPRPHRSAPSG